MSIVSFGVKWWFRNFYGDQMHPPLNLHKHPMCIEIIEQFQKCHMDHPVAKFFGECNDLKVKLDRCFRQERLSRRKQNFEKSKKFKERLLADRLREKEDERLRAEQFQTANSG